VQPRKLAQLRIKQLHQLFGRLLIALPEALN
jgi:hypothetical protein